MRFLLLVFAIFSFGFMIFFLYQEYFDKGFSDREKDATLQHNKNFTLDIHGASNNLEHSIRETIQWMKNSSEKAIQLDALKEILQIDHRIQDIQIQKNSNNKITILVEENLTQYLLNKQNIIKEIGKNKHTTNEYITSLNSYIQFYLPIISIENNNTKYTQKALKDVIHTYQQTWENYSFWNRISEIYIGDTLNPHNSLSKNPQNHGIQFFLTFKKCRITVPYVFPNIINKINAIIYYIENIQKDDFHCKNIYLQENLSLLDTI